MQGRFRTVAVILATAAVALHMIPATGMRAVRADALDVVTTRHVENRRGTLVCTAEFSDAVLTPGRPIEVSLSVTNISDRVQRVGKRGYLEIRPLGQPDIIWSSAPFGSYLRIERPIAPGKTDLIGSGVTTRVRWSGPLKIRPVCPGAGVSMPWFLFEVAVPTPPESTAAAIAAAVAVPGSPFAACPPGPFGEASTGVLPPPDGAPLEPLTVRCWADVRHEEGFDVVALSMASPADAPDYTIPEPRDEIDGRSGGGQLPGEESMLALRWSFVVTADDVRPVLSQLASRISATGEFPIFELSDGEWSRLPGVDECRAWWYGFDPSGRSFWFPWLSACGTGISAAMP